MGVQKKTIEIIKIKIIKKKNNNLPLILFKNKRTIRIDSECVVLIV